MENLQNLECIRAPLPAVLANKLPPMLYDTDLEGVDRYDPVIKVADSPPFARNRGARVFPVGGAERFCFPAIGILAIARRRGQEGDEDVPADVAPVDGRYTFIKGGCPESAGVPILVMVTNKYRRVFK